MAESGQLRDVFSEALKIKTEQGRRQYLDDVCGGDTNFRQLVDELLEAHDEAGSFLTEFDPENTVGTAEIPEGVGTTIGAYELLEHIGEGGMGVVFRAAQSTPVRREVAIKVIKVIKPGMDTREVIARFEAERQALAMMNHPYIARVFDAGTTDSGGPYFVMELVKGLPIRNTATDNSYHLPNVSICSVTSVPPYITLIRKASSTATSNPTTCWSPASMDGHRSRLSILALPRPQIEG